MTEVRERRVEAHRNMWDGEGHSHWRSLTHQPQNAELSRSSGERGSDELRGRDQQDVRIRWGSAQVGVQLRWGFSSGGGSAQVGLPQTKHQRLTTMEDMDYVHYSQ